MPEPQLLYTVTAVVVAFLVAWVAYVLKTAKEPWARPLVAGPTAAPEAKAEEPVAPEPEKVEKVEKAEQAEQAEKVEETSPTTDEKA